MALDTASFSRRPSASRYDPSWMRGARVGEVIGVREERLRLNSTLVGDRALSATTGESGGVEGEGGQLGDPKMDWFLNA